MRHQLPQSLLVMAATLCLAGVVSAQSLLQADCTSDDKQAVLQLANNGKGSLAVVKGDSNYSCDLSLTAIEGPPFTDNATGMLVLDLSREVCAPAAAKRQVQRTVAIHIADPKLTSREATAVIERRASVFQCQVKQLDKAGLAKLFAAMASSN